MRKSLPLLAAVLMLVVASSAEAQVVRPRWYRTRGGFVAVPYAYPYWGWRYPYTFSTTPMESAGRGLAEVIRARGEAYERAARGMASYEEARSKYIENRQKWLDAYRERKRTNLAERREEYQEKRETWQKYLATRESPYPPRLSPSELDPTTGKIYWPDPLQSDDYAELRRELEELFLLRAHTGTSRTYASEIHEKARGMQSELKEHIREMPAGEYIAARNFLESLAHEGRYRTG